MLSAGTRGARTVAPAVAGVVATAVVVPVAMASAVDVRFGAALALGALAIPIALLDLPALIAAWAGLTVFQRAAPFGLVTSGVGLVVIGAWLVRARGDRASIGSALRLHRRLVALIALMLLWLTLSLTWSHDSGVAASKLVDWYVAAAIVIVLLTSLRTARDVYLVAAAVVFAVVTAVALALGGVDPTGGQSASETAPAVEGRLQGVIGDPNFTAAYVLPALVLAVVVRRVAGVWTRALLTPAAIVLVVGLVATQSRGGGIAALTALVTAVLVMRGRRRAVLGIAAGAFVIAAIWLSANPAAVEHLRATDDRGSGRADLWLVARRMSEDHPVKGVGLANFTVRSREYVRGPGSLEYVELIADRPHAVHNSYLQMLAETGIVGLTLFVAISFAAVVSAIRAGRRFELAGERDLALVSRGVGVALTGVLAAGFFISLQVTPTLWILLALGPALFGLTSGRKSAPVTTRASHRGTRSRSTNPVAPFLDAPRAAKLRR